MIINFEINHKINFGQILFVCGSVPDLGNGDVSNARPMECVEPDKWRLSVEVDDATKGLTYSYLIKEKNGNTLKNGNTFAEWGASRTVDFCGAASVLLFDSWQDKPNDEFLYTSAFTDSFFAHPSQSGISDIKGNTFILNVNCPLVDKGQVLALSGASDYMGNWQVERALKMSFARNGKWQIAIPTSEIKFPTEYKYLIIDDTTQKPIRWEESFNRILHPVKFGSRKKSVAILNQSFVYHNVNWKTAGVAIPIFSLRSEDSFGVGEFTDLKKMVDWAVLTNQKIIQTLPVNDTTITGRWTDSYPYNAISIYALHPIYLGAKHLPLKDKALYDGYAKRAADLNVLPELDYEAVFALKKEYAASLFAERGNETLNSPEFKFFFESNKHWLFPYACFCYLRDQYQTADMQRWEKNTRYNADFLKKQIEENPAMKSSVEHSYFVQYLLHVQLSEVKDYAHEKGIILKGDIPIGISRNSVEAWTEPHLFNMDTQTGAPPDDFSVNGQNWGFPTYNWDEMRRTDYQWWKNRFRKMADYFDAYRIDHILGFFRIWEIPAHSVQGLLGYFSPALPFSEDEIRNEGVYFDENRMTKPFIHEYFLHDIFGDYVSDVVDSFLNSVEWQRFELKDICDTQQKIKTIFEGKTDEKSLRIRDGLYALCNEVLFVHDKKEPHKFHPRISAQFTYSYRSLSDEQKTAFNRLYDYFFYYRHNEFWRNQALEKLPELIRSTKMLVCGEDLGMIPDCVPSVMCELQILSLEIQRMPKENNKLFENLSTIPYKSVCTTSTHDMSPLRLWWTENPETTQRYYNEVLLWHGKAPEECTSDIALQIIKNHLASPAMLTILPLQDWLAISDELKNPDPAAERINVPAVAQHYWRYRMHLTLEELIKASSFNSMVKSLITAR